MKFGLFLLYFAIMLFITISLVFFLNDGSIFLVKDKDNHLLFGVKVKVGSKDVAGVVRILCFSIGTGLMASIAPTSSVGGLICFLAMMSAMGYVVYWAIVDAESVKEVLCFIMMLTVCCVVSKMGAIAMGGMIRHYGWASFFRTLPIFTLSVSITIVIAHTLRWYSLRNPHKLKANVCKILSVLSIVVAIIGLIISIAILVDGII